MGYSLDYEVKENVGGEHDRVRVVVHAVDVYGTYNVPLANNLVAFFTRKEMKECRFLPGDQIRVEFFLSSPAQIGDIRSEAEKAQDVLTNTLTEARKVKRYLDFFGVPFQGEDTK